MEWLQPKRKSTRIRFRAMMESGQLLDEVADIVQTQVIARKARASIRNRDAVPLYHHTEEDRPPVWQENLIVETGLSPPPGMDSRYVLEDSLNLWKGIKTGAVELDGESKVSLAIVANVAAVVVFVACAWLAGLNVAPDPPAVQKAAVEDAQEDNRHGFVEELEGPGGQEAGGKGGEDSGGGAEEPMGSRVGGSTGEDNAPGVWGPPQHDS